MASVLNAYLGFTDNTREAMDFYKSVFGGELTLNTFGDFGAKDTPDAAKIMHAKLETERGYVLMASDTPTGMEHRPSNTITLSLGGDDAEELHGYWAKLSESGSVTMPLEKQMWGDEFGMCVDRFGVPWMVNIAVPSV